MYDPDLILDTVKHMLGIESSTTEFDVDVLSDINSAFFKLYQLGVGPSEPFTADEDTSWDEFVTSVPSGVIQNYVHLKTAVVFDPSASATVTQAYNDRIAELEFYMNIEVDNGGGYVTG